MISNEAKTSKVRKSPAEYRATFLSKKKQELTDKSKLYLVDIDPYDMFKKSDEDPLIKKIDVSKSKDASNKRISTDEERLELAWDDLFEKYKDKLGINYFILDSEKYEDLQKIQDINEKIGEMKNQISSYEKLKNDTAYNFFIIDRKTGKVVDSIKKKDPEFVQNYFEDKYEDNIDDYQLVDKKHISDVLASSNSIIKDLEKTVTEKQNSIKAFTRTQRIKRHKMLKESSSWLIADANGNFIKAFKAENEEYAKNKFSKEYADKLNEFHLINAMELKEELQNQTEDTIISTMDGTSNTMTSADKIKAQKALQRKDSVKTVKIGQPLREDELEEVEASLSEKLESALDEFVQEISALAEGTDDKKYKRVMENVVKHLVNAKTALEAVKTHESFLAEKKNAEEEKGAEKNIGSVRKNMAKVIKDKDLVDRIMKKYNSATARKIQQRMPDADPEKLTKAIIKHFIKEEKNLI